ncbi:rad21 rec8 n terminal domain-containing protein [Colletotrichum truncatum]|uniref:Rad21 rec8 n terminal domain-containing protein n=1 Tax=Colletotrichum truncatum TaxID=5467 RepID=A0ACC3Z043_COLTU|nr:rad21 rec8 n terminal domain-containing protein [Colletotrichum truncatum]KAF6800768.1 rad21 rec8 n terminal domain-containing protein [Colletotrichum truncatum]
MFYSHEILASKQYGVATIWHVANFGPKGGVRRLSRKAIDDVNIPRACDKIMDPGPPISLRLQSNLLYGVTCVYSRQCHYTLNDSEKIRETMKTMVVVYGDSGIDTKAGKTRREQITLSDDPRFILSNKIPEFKLDSGESLFPSQPFLSSGGKKSQSQLSPFPSPSILDFASPALPIHLDLSQSSSPNAGFQFPSPHIHGSAANTFLPKTRDDLDMDMHMDPFGILDDDGGLHMSVGLNGELIDDDLELPVLPGTDLTEDSVQIQDQQQSQELPQNEQDQIAFNQDDDVPMVGNDVAGPQEEEALQSVRSPEQARIPKAVAPVAKRGRRVLMLDRGRTTIARSSLKSWDQDYLENAAAARSKRKRSTRAQARAYAYQIVLGRGINNVGDLRGVTGVTYPLAQTYAGNGLRDRIWGPSLDQGHNSSTSSPGGSRRRRQRSSEEAFGEEEQERKVRPKLEETPQQGRSMDDVLDFDLLLNDESMPEIGMEAAQPLADHMSSSLMPWNHTPSVGRGSSIGPNSQQGGRQLSMRGSSIPPFEPLRDVPDGDIAADLIQFPGAEGLGELVPAALLDIGQQQNQDETHWSRSAMDTASQEFLRWTEEETKTTGYIKEGDSNENRRWVAFESLVPPGQQNHVVAAQAFYHILSLATKNVIKVEQDVERLEPFGTIRVGIDMTAQLDNTN